MDKKILLIEDEYFISYLYQKQFELMGQHIDVAADGNSGIEAIQKNHYDLILLDIMLPGINGIDILKKVKSDEQTKHMSVIMLTNLAQDDIMDEAFKHGADGYWIKANLSPKEIVINVNKFFEER